MPTLLDFLANLYSCAPEKVGSFLRIQGNVKLAYNALRSKKLSVPYLGDSYKFYLRGFHLEPTSQDVMSDGSNQTINQYMEQVRGITLKYKDLPSAVSPGKGKMYRFPLEVVQVERKFSRWDKPAFTAPIRRHVV